ncbi:glycosyltransferase family 2 protein [Williamsia sp.]|uniref:glycosyltransferase n=1 Tax=Williamsia sp. TaxID=1872085 RepID=UPI001A23BFB0|nr:glycosyltransferase family 2 protein [Williamsia sp.]MBJ7289749.1 glycosyltransferase family 2 protein [Williamsia sp.]
MRIAVIVVTYNSSAVVRPCLQALVGDPDIELIVYDNNSSDSTCTLVTDEFPTARLIRGGENLGFARAVNRAAATRTSPLLMLLNPDAVISAASVMELCDIADAEPGTVIAPRVVDPGGTAKIAGAGRFPHPWAMFTHYSGLSRLSSDHPSLAGHYLTARQADGPLETIPTDWVSGACMVLHGALWDQLGGMSERWFMYAEDIELCWRAARFGLPRSAPTPERCRLVTTVEATHLVGQSSPRRRGTTAGSELTRSTWVVNLYDFYCSSMARHRHQCVTWGLVTAGGLTFRAVVFALQAVAAGPDTRAVYLRRSADFLHHAADVLRLVPSATTRGLRGPL